MERIRQKITHLQRARLSRVLVALTIIVTLVSSLAAVSFAADLGLIEATTLKANGSKWVVLDSRSKADWEAGHIPGAIQFFWDSYTRTDARGVKYSSFPPPGAGRCAGRAGDRRENAAGGLRRCR